MINFSRMKAIIKLKQKDEWDTRTGGISTQYELFVPLHNIIPSNVDEGKFQVFSNAHDLVAVFNFSKRHLNWRLWGLLPVNWAGRNFVQHLQKYPSEDKKITFRGAHRGFRAIKKIKYTYPFLTSSNRLLTYVSVPRLLIHSRKALSSLETWTSSGIISARGIFLHSVDRPFLEN